jgi:hypothetical protein
MFCLEKPDRLHNQGNREITFLVSAGNIDTQRNFEIWKEFIRDTYPVVRNLRLPEVPRSSPYFVVIAEPRKHPHLEYVLRNVMHFLGDSWGLQIFAGQQNMQFIEEFTRDWGCVHIDPLGVDNLDTRGYNQLKKSVVFWERVQGEHILWIEPDCLLRRRGIEEFLQYDYIGAPWAEHLAVSPCCRVGNGGLSLRRKCAMLEIARNANPDFKLFAPEDVFFCVNMNLCNVQHPGKFALPSLQCASHFSVESIYYSDPLGLHKVWEHLPADQVHSLLSDIEY